MNIYFTQKTDLKEGVGLLSFARLYFLSFINGNVFNGREEDHVPFSFREFHFARDHLELLFGLADPSSTGVPGWVALAWEALAIDTVVFTSRLEEEEIVWLNLSVIKGFDDNNSSGKLWRKSAKSR